MVAGDECPVPGFEDSRPLKGHVVADARASRSPGRRRRPRWPPPSAEFVFDAIIQGDDACGIGRLMSQAAGATTSVAGRGLTGGEGEVPYWFVW